MRLTIPMFCLPLLGACTGTPMGTDAATMADSAMSDSGPRADGAVGVDAADGVDTGTPSCAYPAGAVEPMALDAVLWPYRWPEAIGGDGTTFPLDLQDVPCTADENIDWSPFDVLVFIAIPGW